jgi:hypothetical protein
MRNQPDPPASGRFPFSRRSLIQLGAVAPIAPLGRAAARSLTAGSPRWELRWRPDPARDGLAAFEALEDDRRGSNPEQSPHIYVSGNTYRFDAHLADRDGSDRMRNEVRGMRVHGTPLVVGKGETLPIAAEFFGAPQNGTPQEIREGEIWRIRYEMYVPPTLHATSNFTHIWQLKVSDVGTPVAQLSLPIHGGVEQIEARYWTQSPEVANPIGAVDLNLIQGRWVTVTLEFASAHDGYLRWKMQDPRGRTLIDVRKDDIDLWFTKEQYNRPKWGIYRSIKSSGLEDTYLLVRNLEAWQLGPATPPVRLPAPDRSPGAYEAERFGNIFQGATEAAYSHICSGGRVVLNIGGNITDYLLMRGILADTTATAQMTIYAVVNGSQTFDVSVNGGDAIVVPMTGTPDVVSTATVPIPLVAGVNTLRFFNLTDLAPQLDKVVIH